MNRFELNDELKIFCQGRRANESITVFNPVEQTFVFEKDLQEVLKISLEDLNNSSFARPFSTIDKGDHLIPEPDREVLNILLVAMYSTFFEYKSSFRNLKDYLYCSFRLNAQDGELVRIEKETHAFEDKESSLLLVDMWRRIDFKKPHRRMEWGPSVVTEKKELIEQTIKTHLYRNLGIAPLSNREEEILKLISKGKTLQSVGESLFIERNTVKKHLENIKRKLSEKFDKNELSSKDQISNVVRELGILDI